MLFKFVFHFCFSVSFLFLFFVFVIACLFVLPIACLSGLGTRRCGQSLLVGILVGLFVLPLLLLEYPYMCGLPVVYTVSLVVDLSI